MRDILSIDGADFAGAVGHMVAGQMFGVIAEEDPRSTTWYGDGAVSERTAQHIRDMTSYVIATGCGGEQLWRWALGRNLILDDVPESGDYAEAPDARRHAFQLFATITLAGFNQISAAQEAARAATALDQVGQGGEPLKLEDSIFEPHGSLGDMEPHQAQFLKDQAVFDRAALEAAAEIAAQEVEAVSLGVPMVDQDDNKPPALSVGEINAGGDDAEEAAGEGQEEGDPAENNPASEGSADGSDDPALPREPAPAGEDVPPASVSSGETGGVAKAVAEPAAGGDASDHPAAGEAVTDKKRKTRKSSN